MYVHWTCVHVGVPNRQTSTQAQVSGSDSRPRSVAGSGCSLKASARPPSLHDDSSLAAVETFAMLHSWQSRLAESAALEAAVVAEMTAEGLPSFPVRANSVDGSTLLSQNSFVAPSASRSPAAPPTPSHPLAAGRGVTSCASLSSRINSRSHADYVAGSLFDAATARCRFRAPARSLLLPGQSINARAQRR